MWLTQRRKRLIDKYRAVIREKAITQAKVEIAMAGKYVTDYDQQQLEVIVKAQEDKIMQKYRNSTFVVLLLILGIA
jgi:homoserine kinase